MKLKQAKLFTVLMLAGAMCAFSARSDSTTTSSNGVTTITGTGTTSTDTSASSTTNFWSDVVNVLGDIGLSSNPTNYAAGVFTGIKTSGDQYSIGAYVVENVNNNIGVMVGIDQLFGGGKTDSENVASGGLTLKAGTHPLRFLTSATNTWAYNLVATPYVAALVTTPIGGTGDSAGSLGALVRSGVIIDVYNLNGWKIGVGADYGNRTGCGNYNGNWIDLTFNVRKGF